MLWTDYLWSLKIRILKMDLEIIIVSEGDLSQTEKEKYHMIT